MWVRVGMCGWGRGKGVGQAGQASLEASAAAVRPQAPHTRCPHPPPRLHRHTRPAPVRRTGRRRRRRGWYAGGVPPPTPPAALTPSRPSAPCLRPPCDGRAAAAARPATQEVSYTHACSVPHTPTCHPRTPACLPPVPLPLPPAHRRGPQCRRCPTCLRSCASAPRRCTPPSRTTCSARRPTSSPSWSSTCARRSSAAWCTAPYARCRCGCWSGSCRGS